MDEQIKEHLKRLNKYYLLLLKARETPFETWEDFKVFEKKVVDFLGNNPIR